MDDFVNVLSPTKNQFPHIKKSVKDSTSLEDDLVKATEPEKDLQNRRVGDTEKSESRLAFLYAHTFVRAGVIDKIYGCIIGSALGDAIGLYTEFLPRHACAAIYKSGKFSFVDPITESYADSQRLCFEP